MDTMDVARYKDAAETPWGAYIMRSIKGYVSSQLSLVEKAQKACATDEALSAAYTATLTSDAARMSDILAANTWDALYSAGVSGAWARLGRIKKDATYSERLQEYIKALRDRYKKAIDGKCKAVYGLSSEVLDDLKKTESSVRGMFALVAQFSARYTAKKTAHGILDFNDLEHETINLLLTTKTHEQTPIALDITKQYAEIMVDEYQDSNAVQEAIFNAVSTGSNRFMVGDVKQSIYMFRLADPTIFLNHYNAYGDYRTVSDGAPRKIILSKNFRSRPEILNATNAVMSACMSPSVGGINYDATESLMPGREDFTPSATPVVELNVIDMDDIHTDDDTESLAKVDVEAKYVAERIKTMLDTETIMDDETGTMRPILASDIAILMRSTRNSARHYTKALTELGISSKSTRGGSLLDTSEIAT
ncbi:MAG: UvrD-helicase domain-containing protein, partial [Ruthenibacterium sp.]